MALREIEGLSINPCLPVGRLSIPRALVLRSIEGSDRGVEWVDFSDLSLNIFPHMAMESQGQPAKRAGQNSSFH
jgi:hypothetical protein